MTSDETKTRDRFLDLERAEWWFLIAWGLVSAVGLVIGMYVNALVGWSGGWLLFAGWAAYGAVVGTAQWIVLRTRFRRSGWWVLASAVGMAVGMAVGLAVDLAVGMVGTGAVRMVVVEVVGMISVGAVVGTAQWIVLRKRICRSGWWVLAGTVGWAAGRAVGMAMSTSGGLVVGWLIGGTMMGFVLAKLLRHPIPEVRVL